MSEKLRVMHWLYRQEFTGEVLSFSDLLISAAKGALGQSDIDAEAYVYQNAGRFWNYLLQQIDEDLSRGRYPLFSVADESSSRVRWFAKDLFGRSSPRERRLGVRLSARPSVLCHIDVMGSRSYEALGCTASHMIGASKTKLTPSNNEGGIDFFALVVVPGKSHLFSGTSGPLRVIGQSKKYESKVQVDKVKEFVQTIEKVKNRNPSVEHHVPAWFRSSPGPVVGWMIAHSGFQSGAADKAKNHGIVTSDSIDLAEIVTLSRMLREDVSSPTRLNCLDEFVKFHLTTIPT